MRLSYIGSTPKLIDKLTLKVAQHEDMIHKLENVSLLGGFRRNHKESLPSISIPNPIQGNWSMAVGQLWPLAFGTNRLWSGPFPISKLASQVLMEENGPSLYSKRFIWFQLRLCSNNP